MASQIVEYRVISKTDISEVIELVNDLINDGWQPQGGVSVAIQTYKVPSSEGYLPDSTESEFHFIQAMVR